MVLELIFIGIPSPISFGWWKHHLSNSRSPPHLFSGWVGHLYSGGRRAKCQRVNLVLGHCPPACWHPPSHASPLLPWSFSSVHAESVLRPVHSHGGLTLVSHSAVSKPFSPDGTHSPALLLHHPSSEALTATNFMDEEGQRILS